MGAASAVALMVAAHPARAETAPSVAGDYFCKSDCHPSDAPPSIEIRGDVAVCRNDLGGVFYGLLLDPRSVACFKMVGTLSPDGRHVTWTNGGVWERRR